MQMPAVPELVQDTGTQQTSEPEQELLELAVPSSAVQSELVVQRPVELPEVQVVGVGGGDAEVSDIRQHSMLEDPGQSPATEVLP